MLGYTIGEMEALFDKAEAGNSQCMLLVRCCMKFRNSMYIFWLIIVFFIHFLNSRNSEIPRLFFLLIRVFYSEE